MTRVGRISLHYLLVLLNVDGILSVASSTMSMSLFKTETICEQIYGTPLQHSFQDQLLQCARICGADPTCKSFLFTPGIKRCSPNLDILIYPNITCGQKALYSEKVNRCGTSNQAPCQMSSLSSTTTTTTTSTTSLPVGSGPGYTTTGLTGSTTSPTPYGPQDWMYMMYPYFYMSDPCTSNTECAHILQSECRYSLCQCKRGYVFDWIAGSCVNLCQQYGHSFQIEQDAIFRGFVMKQETGVTENACLDKCVQEPSFVCRTATYERSTMHCELSADSPPYFPTEFQILSNVYERDCLFP